MLNSVKNNMNFTLLIQLSPFFLKHPAAHKYLTWPLSDVIVGMKGNPEVTQKKIILPNVCVPILAKQ